MSDLKDVRDIAVIVVVASTFSPRLREAVVDAAKNIRCLIVSAERSDELRKTIKEIVDSREDYLLSMTPEIAMPYGLFDDEESSTDNQTYIDYRFVNHRLDLASDCLSGRPEQRNSTYG